VREEFILRKDEILMGEFKSKGDSPEKPSPGKKEELPSTSVRNFNSGTEIKDSLKVLTNYILFSFSFCMIKGCYTPGMPFFNYTFPS